MKLLVLNTIKHLQKPTKEHFSFRPVDDRAERNFDGVFHVRKPAHFTGCEVKFDHCYKWQQERMPDG